ncbi:MAG: ribosomal protein [Rickettsiaceae bacterium]|jgi:large subunit ribosomal protein L1|nr:ribosomal protein [Rickettsiaceae bacterium]
MSKDNNVADIYNLEEALKKVLDLSKQSERKFVESVDIAVNLGIDGKQSDQMVKGSLVLPNGSGKKVRVLVFAANDEVKKAALSAGAAFAGLEDLVSKIEGGFLDFDCCIATPDVMQKISKVAKKLGPRGLMPSPKNGTVTTDVKKAVEDALKGKVDFKSDKAGTVHCLVGKANFEFDALLGNLKAVIKSIKDAKPEAAKGKYIKDFYINTTMGTAVKVATQSL